MHLKFIQEMTVTSNFIKRDVKTSKNFYCAYLQGSLERWWRGKEPSSVRSLKFEQIGPRPLSLIPVHTCLLDNWHPDDPVILLDVAHSGYYGEPVVTGAHSWILRPIKDRLYIHWCDSLQSTRLCSWDVWNCGRWAPISSRSSNTNRPFFSRQDLKW